MKHQMGFNYFTKIDTNFISNINSQDDKNHFNEDGMPNRRFPNHWKGENGLYCSGFGRQGLLGISNDAQKIASDISLALGIKVVE